MPARTVEGGFATSVLAALLYCDAALAQDSGAAAVLERVVVTGSHIAQTDIEGALPVQVITREEIERSGVTSVELLLDRVPASLNGTATAQTVGSQDQPGFSSANLRGLGSGSTLVLLNGRRLANYAFNGEAVDLNSIPLAAIQRVEMLRDGASAIYGTDAIGGVINFVLRKDYVGAETAASYDVTQHGGGNGAQASLTLGTGDPERDGYNLFGVISYQHQQALRGSERESTRTGYRPDLGVVSLSPFTFPSNIIDRAGRRVLNPTIADGCTPPLSLPYSPAPLFTPACGFDAAAAADVLPDVERASALLRGTWRAGPSTDAFAEILVGGNRFDSQIAPYPQPAVATSFGSPVYPVGGPFYPTEFAAANALAGDLLFTWRATELGPRKNTTTADAQRYVIGLEGQAAGWDYNVSAVYSANQQAVEYAGSYLYQSAIIPALRSGLVNPWGPSGSEGKALLESAVYRGTPQTADGSTTLINGFASGALARLPDGPLAAALGAEARRERLSYDWDPAVVSGDSPIGSLLKAISGSRNVLALFAELNVPIASKLAAQLAVRRDDYSDFGSTTNPKVALRWQPLPALLLRSSWGKGFRAPPLYSLNEPNVGSEVAGPISDPIRCPVTDSVDDCFGAVPFTTGGNPGLKPETSKQWNAGLVWEPAHRLSLAIDYWRIEQTDIIGVPLFDSVDAFAARFPDRLIRGPVDPATPDLPGPIVAIDGSVANLGTTRTSGIDAALDWRLTATEAGDFRIALQGSYVRRYETQFKGDDVVSLLGSAVGGLPVPRWRSNVTLDWNRGPWGATLAHLYASGYVEPLPPPATETRRVAAAETWDLQVRYGGFAGWHWAIGIRNVLDKDPPFSLTSSFQFGFNPQVASPLGRVFYLRTRYAFK